MATLAPEPTAPAESRTWTAALTLMLLAIALVMLSRTYDDPDLWGHVRFGGDLWRTRDLYRADVYSYLSGPEPWINHEWLAELAFYAAYAVAGARGLIALKAAVGLAIVALLHGQSRRSGLSSALAAGLTILAMALALSGLTTVRPHIFTYLGLLLLLLLLVDAEASPSRRLWGLVPLFALWPNLHGGFLAGAGILVLWCAVRALQAVAGRQALAVRRFSRQLLLPSAVALLATLLNPYGWRLWAFLLRTATVPRPEISEWSPLSMMTLEGAVYLALLVLAWLGLALSRRPRRPALVAVLGLLSLLPPLAQRHAILFAVSVPVLAGPHIGDAFRRWWAPHAAAQANVKSRQAGPWVALACALASLPLFPLAWSNAGCLARNIAEDYPVCAVSLLRQAGVAGNLAVDFDWGEYVLWHLGPEVQVSVDGRRETVYSDEVYRENLRFMFGTGDWDALLVERPTDMALVSKARPTYNLMRLEPGWVLVYEDDLSALFARQGSDLAAQLAAAAPVPANCAEGTLCFP